MRLKGNQTTDTVQSARSQPLTAVNFVSECRDRPPLRLSTKSRRPTGLQCGEPESGSRPARTRHRSGVASGSRSAVPACHPRTAQDRASSVHGDGPTRDGVHSGPVDRCAPRSLSPSGGRYLAAQEREQFASEANSRMLRYEVAIHGLSLGHGNQRYRELPQARHGGLKALSYASRVPCYG